MLTERATVLIVDDEPMLTDIISTDLGEQGYRCLISATGEDALRRLSAEKVDVALVDLRLPGISGMGVLREIASNYPLTAAIVVTGVGDTQTAVEVMKAGAADYISKPFEPERLRESLETALGKAGSKEKKSATVRGSPATSEDEVDWLSCLNAIARGVELRLESLTSGAVTRTIVDEAIGIARSLEIPEDQIERWGDTKQKENAKRLEAMNSLLKKLERNPIAPTVLGMTDLYQCPPSHDDRLS